MAASMQGGSRSSGPCRQLPPHPAPSYSRPGRKHKTCLTSMLPHSCTMKLDDVPCTNHKAPTGIMRASWHQGSSPGWQPLSAPVTIGVSAAKVVQGGTKSGKSNTTSHTHYIALERHTGWRVHVSIPRDSPSCQEDDWDGTIWNANLQNYNFTKLNIIHICKRPRCVATQSLFDSVSPV